MANFCRFCGRELINGQCSCPDAQAVAQKNQEQQQQQQYQQQQYQQQQYQQQQYQQQQYQQQGEKDPFFISNFNLDFSSVSNFMSSMRNQSGLGEQINGSNDAYEHNVPIVPDCIEQEDNEIVVKQYNIAKLRTRLKFMKAEGRLQVTNRRILFRAAGTSLTGNILQEHQFNLDEIGGIEMHKDYKFSFLNFFGSVLLNYIVIALLMALFSRSDPDVLIPFGIILGILGLAPTFCVYKRFWLKLFCAMIGNGAFSIANMASRDSEFLSIISIIAIIITIIDIVIVCFVPNLVIKIKTKGAEGAVVIGSQKSMFRRQTGDDYSGFVEVLPWEDTVMAMNEIGTMIDDLQKQGDYAVEKWSK